MGNLKLDMSLVPYAWALQGEWSPLPGLLLLRGHSLQASSADTAGLHIYAYGNLCGVAADRPQTDLR